VSPEEARASVLEEARGWASVLGEARASLLEEARATVLVSAEIAVAHNACALVVPPT
jgi:hypothetical protein